MSLLIDASLLPPIGAPLTGVTLLPRHSLLIPFHDLAAQVQKQRTELWKFIFLKEVLTSEHHDALI